MRLSATLGVAVGTCSRKGVPGLSRVISSTTIGAGIGAGFPAGAPDGPHSIGPAVPAAYSLYRELSTTTTATVPALAEREKRTIRTTTEEPR